MLDALAATAKALLYVGLLSSAGVALAEASLRGPPGIASFAMRVIARGSLLTMVATLAGALILVLRLGGQFDSPTLSAVFLSGSGAAIGLQLAGSILLLSTTGEHSSTPATRLSNAAIVLLSLAIYGHAATAGGQEAAVALVHVAAAAWWIGSLWLLHHACIHIDPHSIAQLVGRFSRQALYLTALLAITGSVLILSLVDFNNRPLTEPYVQILAAKMGFVVLVLGLASYNRLRLTPFVLAGDRTAIASLRRMVEFELVIIGAILVTTAILTTYVSPPELPINAAALAS